MNNININQIDYHDLKAIDLQPKYVIRVDLYDYIKHFTQIFINRLRACGHHDFLKVSEKPCVVVPGLDYPILEDTAVHLVLGNMLNNQAVGILTAKGPSELISVLSYGRNVIRTGGTLYRVLGLSASERSKKVIVDINNLTLYEHNNSYIEMFVLHSFVAYFNYLIESSRDFDKQMILNLSINTINTVAYKALEEDTDTTKAVKLIDLFDAFFKSVPNLNTIRELIIYNPWEIFTLKQPSLNVVQLENIGDYRIYDWQLKYEIEQENSQKLKTF